MLVLGVVSCTPWNRSISTLTFDQSHEFGIVNGTIDQGPANNEPGCPAKSQYRGKSLALRNLVVDVCGRHICSKARWIKAESLGKIHQVSRVRNERRRKQTFTERLIGTLALRCQHSAGRRIRRFTKDRPFVPGNLYSEIGIALELGEPGPKYAAIWTTEI